MLCKYCVFNNARIFITDVLQRDAFVAYHMLSRHV